MIIALMGAAGSGKDTVGRMLVQRGMERISFGDAVYREVSEAFFVSEKMLRYRAWKEEPNPRLCLDLCHDAGYVGCMKKILESEITEPVENILRIPLSPRKILQTWATEYKRSSDEDYWVRQVMDVIDRFPHKNWVITDLRFPNEWKSLSERRAVCVLVQGRLSSNVSNHASEQLYKTLQPDYVIDNSGDMLQLENQVQVIWNKCLETGY